jgi:diguanylate cyclase (GGDEF)-like protein
MWWVPGRWAALARAQRWPGIRTPALMARTCGACYLFGGFIVATLVTVAPMNFNGTKVQYANAAVAGLMGVVVLLWGERLRPWQFHAMVAVAILQITVSVNQATNPVIAVSLATLYVFVACAAFFVAWPAAVLELALAVICCLAAMTLSQTVPWWSGLVAAGTTALIGTVITILGRVVAKAELDDISGIPNRRGFDRMLSDAVGRAQSGGPRFAVILVCIDGYGAFREEFGGQAADELIQQIVTSWRSILEPEQILARRGIDEFTALLPGLTDQQGKSLTERLRVAAERSCSAGVTAWQPGESASVTLARADTALRRAKLGGRNRTMVESADLPSLALELRDALAAGEVNVLYQPVVSLASGAMVGVEALVRWTPPSHPDAVAAEVVKVAEESNLIAALGNYVLRRACSDAYWIQQQAPGLTLYLSVNVSGLELIQDEYATLVFDALKETGWAAEQLVLEVTESVLDVDRPSSIAALAEFRAGGLKVAIDDFGTGYSSLSRLHALPTDFLKLDASFIAAVAPPSRDAPPLLHAVAAMAVALQLPVVVEGVENAHQASVLRGLGFAMAQGFYFGRAQTPRDLVAALTQPARKTQGVP